MPGRMVAGESNKMMAAEGSGPVLYGYRGLHVTVIDLTAGALVEADRLLGHDANLSTQIDLIAQAESRGQLVGP